MRIHPIYLSNACLPLPTGCLFLESVQLPAGDHTFSLRHDKDFIQMTLDCSITSDDDYNRELSINVTTNELGPPGGLKEITVVWFPNLGRVGVRHLTNSHTRLSQKDSFKPKSDVSLLHCFIRSNQEMTPIKNYLQVNLEKCRSFLSTKAAIAWYIIYHSYLHLKD